MEKEDPSRIIYWKETNGGLSYMPVAVRLGIKVQPATSDGYSLAFPGVNIYFDKDIYIFMEKTEQFHKLCASFILEKVDRYLNV